MLLYVQPPPPAAVYSSEELPLLPGSDPLILAAYQWTVAHSPSLQQVVRQLTKVERKARYRLTPGLDLNYGRLLVSTTEEEYHIDIQVPILPWRRSGDALEPWIASALFLALEIASKGEFRDTHDPDKYRFFKKTRFAAFAFQAKVRQEIFAFDPDRLRDMPDGSILFQQGFPATSRTTKGLKQRPLPDGLK